MTLPKKAATLTLVAIFLMSSFAVFAAGSGEKAATGAEDKAVTLAVRDNFAGLTWQPYAKEYLEEHTNTSITLIRMLPDELQEKLNLLLASGERPDLVQFYRDDFEFELTDSGLLRPLNDILDTQAPNLKREWGDAVWNAMTHPDDGNIYAFPAENLANSVHFATMYREDWLDELGMSVPTTVDEYYDVAVAMSQDDPDGNGKDDTYAFGGFQGYAGERYFDHIFGAYGTHVNQWIKVDGKIVNGSVLPGAKEGLRMMKRLFDAGAIDPEFITDDETRSANKVEIGLYGAPNFYVFMFGPNHRYYRNFQSNVPGGVWVHGGPLAGGSSNPLGQRMLNQRGWLKTALVNGSKNPDGAVRIIDWLASDEGALYSNYGIPGEDFTVDNNGMVTRITEADDYHARSISQFWIASRDLSLMGVPQSYLDVIALVNENPVPNANDGLIVPEKAEYEDDLRIFAREQFAKMTVGEIPIDPGFDQFVQAWNSRGGKALTDALNKKAGL